MVECNNSITVVYCTKSGVHTIQGNPSTYVCMHSCAKLLQILPLLDRDLDIKYGLTPDEISFMVSSHLGQEEHISTFNSILQKTGLKEDDMILPESSPCGRLAYYLWSSQNGVKSKRYNPCAGNHLAMMLVQRELAGCVNGYESLHSKVQKEILSVVSQFSKIGKSEISIVTDHCGVPAFTLPMHSISYIYQQLAALESKDYRIARLLFAIHSAPRMIEGDGCISTILNSYPNLIAKTGTDGLLTIALLEQQIGIAIKSLDGWKSVSDQLIACLNYLHLLPDNLKSDLDRIFNGSNLS